MLGKLLKYELKATSRSFLPFLGAILALSVINKLSTALISGNSWIFDLPVFLLTFLYIAMIMAASIFCIILTVQRFYKGLLGREGYLMFTLPVTAAENILSKGIASLIWILMTVLTTFLSICVFLPGTEALTLIREGWGPIVLEIHRDTGLDVNFLLPFMLLLSLLGCCSFVMELYAAMSIGQLFNSHRLLCSFGAYLGICVGEQIFATILMNLIVGPLLFHFYPESKAMMFDNHMIGQALNCILWFALVLEILSGVTCFLISRGILSRRLNLE